MSDIMEIIDCARLAPTGANLQSLKYFIIEDEADRRAIYPMIKYAGYLPDWNPEFEECPPVFVAVLNDTKIKPTEKAECDSGAAIMSMCLAAEEMGIGSCWLGAIDREGIMAHLKLAEDLDLMYLVGLGYADQTAKICDFKDSVKYYMEDEILYVPKRSIKDVLITREEK